MNDEKKPKLKNERRVKRIVDTNKCRVCAIPLQIKCERCFVFFFLFYFFICSFGSCFIRRCFYIVVPRNYCLSSACNLFFTFVGALSFFFLHCCFGIVIGNEKHAERIVAKFAMRILHIIHLSFHTYVVRSIDSMYVYIFICVVTC